MKKALREYLRQLGSRGGKQAAENMTAAERRARAIKASSAARKARRGGAQ